MAFNVSFIVRLQDRFSGTAKNVNRQLKIMNDRARKVSEGFRDVGSAITRRATLPIAAFGAIGIRTAFNFEKQMNAVAAVTQSTGAEFESLKNVAKELGRTTQFSASQAAAGMAFLGQTGFDANQIMATIGDTLNLAAASGLDLATAADIASNILKGFGEDVSQMSRFVDVLALTAAKSNTNVFQLGEAMKFVAPVAAAAGLKVEETAAAMGVLGDAGIQGSLAGTGLKTIISKLLTQTDKLAPVLKGTSLESDGFAAVINKLAESGLSATQAFELFEQRGAPAILALVAEARRLKSFTKELNNAEGTAKRMSAIRMRGIVGSFLRLKSAVEGVFLAFFDAPEVLKFIEKITDALTRLATKISNLSPRARIIILIFLAFVAVVGPLLLLLGLFAIVLTTLIPIITSVGVAFAGTAIGASLFGKALIGLVTFGGIAIFAAAILAIGVLLGEFFVTKAVDAFINKFSSLNKEARKLKETLDIDIEPKIIEGLKGVKIPKGLEDQTKQLFLLNAAIAETKLQFRGGITKGLDVTKLQEQLESLVASKNKILGRETFGPPTLETITAQQQVTVDVKLQLETDRNTNLKSLQAKTNAPGDVSIEKTGPNVLIPVGG